MNLSSISDEPRIFLVYVLFTTISHRNQLLLLQICRYRITYIFILFHSHFFSFLFLTIPSYLFQLFFSSSLKLFCAYYIISRGMTRSSSSSCEAPEIFYLALLTNPSLSGLLIPAAAIEKLLLNYINLIQIIFYLALTSLQ